MTVTHILMIDSTQRLIVIYVIFLVSYRDN